MVVPTVKLSLSKLVSRNQIGKQLWKMRLPLTRGMQIALDLGVLAEAFILAYLLRFDFSIPKQELSGLLIQLPFVMFVQLACLRLHGVYAFIWRYVGLAELKVFIRAGFYSALVLAVMRFALPSSLQPFRVPVSVILMDSALAFGSIVGVRVLRRVLFERYERQHLRSPVAERAKSVLLIGADRGGISTVEEILNHGELNLRIMGFIDDEPAKHGAIVHGIKVLGGTASLPSLVREHRIDTVIVSMVQTSKRELRRILELCEEAQVKAQLIPRVDEILDGKVNVTRLRDVQVDDLLGRQPVTLDEVEMKRFLAGKRVMVTGAGGSIGSELARQVAMFQPLELMLVERAEFALFNIHRELREGNQELCITPLVGDVGDDARMRPIFATHRPQVILHAAAHKHVPMMELTPTEAIKNNVLGTYTIAKLAAETGVEVFVLISTDKAVRPRSVMGASKRVAELVVQYLNKDGGTRFVAVRFGNVIGSAGSVIPIFRDQIRRGGPVTVTHPEMMRYFMTIAEAAQLVLQAGAMGKGGEIFVLDMGEPVNILDLAKDVITLSGLKPYEEIDIVITGMRPGEKLFEEIEMNDEQMTRTRHAKIFIGNIATYPETVVSWALRRLAILTKQGRDDELRQLLGDLLPEAQLGPANENERTAAVPIARAQGAAVVKTSSFPLAD